MYMQRLFVPPIQPWERSWLWVEGENRWVLLYLIVLHLLTFAGLIFYTWPGWPIFLSTFFLCCVFSLGTTLGYHRCLAHRAVQLHPKIKQFLIFCAMFNGSGSPTTWVGNHRNHHANEDKLEDVSSPRFGGFWWAHLRWLYQWEPSSIQKWAPDMMKPEYAKWASRQIPLVFTSLVFGYFLAGLPGMLWLGAIRMAWCLHGQCFVNSLMHLKPGLPMGVDSSRNIWWIGPFLTMAWGENWHRNHHALRWCAKFSRVWWQIDIAWYIICLLEWRGLAWDVRRPPAKLELLAE